MQKFIITTGSEYSYTKVIVVAADISAAKAMLGDWCDQCTSEEAAACLTDGNDASAFVHSFDPARILAVAADDMEDYEEFQTEGVHMIDSGLNG